MALPSPCRYQAPNGPFIDQATNTSALYAYDAQTIESEQGVNILYLALGFLKWFEPRDLERPRYAPLILVPATLARASATERFKLTYSGEVLPNVLPQARSVSS